MSNRCLVCNTESFTEQFCSQECEDVYNQVMEDIIENNLCQEDEIADEEE